MGSSRPDPRQVISDLIANAIATARVLGESRRITSLVAGSVQRFVAEMEEGEVDAFLAHALECITTEDEAHVPTLHAELQAIVLSRA